MLKFLKKIWVTVFLIIIIFAFFPFRKIPLFMNPTNYEKVRKGYILKNYFEK